MGKIIFWLVVIFVVLLVLRLINLAASRSRDGPAASKRNLREAAMIRCVDCGVYLPSADATTSPRGPLCGDPQCVARRNAR
jgi:hypothetical protein